VVVALLWALPSALVAQSGRIIGLTVDSSGQGLGGVTVTATTITGSSRSAVSTPNGNFVIEPLAPGNYQLRATRQGLPPVTRQVQVGVGSLDVRIVMGTAAPQPQNPQSQPQLISPTAPQVPLPRDSLKLPVPDSAILGMRQSEGRVAFTPRVGQRARLVLLDTVSVTLEITRAIVTPDGSEAWGDVITESGARRGVATIVVRGDQVVANVRRGLRLFQIRPQARGIHLIVEVDQKKMPARDSDAPAGGAQ
jgi:hypothetical protein